MLDLLLLTKHADGSVEAVELREVDDSEIGPLRVRRWRLRHPGRVA